MSWRAIRFKSYNRKQELEEVNYWYQFLFQDDNNVWDSFDEFGPWGFDWDYPGSGLVHNMDEYHQMHLLTLLRKLNVKIAIKIVKQNGW